MSKYFTNYMLAVMVVGTVLINAYYLRASHNREKELTQILQAKLYELHESKTILQAYQIYNDQKIPSRILEVKFNDSHDIIEGSVYRAYPILYEGKTIVIFIHEKVEG